MDMRYKDLPRKIPNDGSQKKIKQSVIKKLEDDILLYELVNQDCSYYSGLIERLKIELIELIELKEKSKSRRPSSSKSKSRQPSSLKSKSRQPFSSKSKSGLPPLIKKIYFKEGSKVGLPKIIETREYDGTQAQKVKGGVIGDDEAGVSPDEAGVSPDEAGVSPDEAGVEEPQQSLCTDNCTDRSCNSEYTDLFIFLWRFYVARAPTIDTDIWFDFLINPNSVIGDKTFTYTLYHDYTGGSTAQYVVKLRIRVEKDGSRRIIKIIYSILIEYNNEIHLSYFYNFYFNRPAHCKPANVCAIHFTFNSDKTRRLDFSYNFIFENFYKPAELNFTKSLILFALFAYKLAGYINDNASLSGHSYDEFSQEIKDWLYTIERHPISGRRPIKNIVGITRFLCAITIGILNYLKSIPAALYNDKDEHYIAILNKVYQLDALLASNPHIGGSAAHGHASHFPLRSVCGNKLQSDKITNYNNKIAKLKEDIKELRKNKKLNKIDKKKELIEKLKLNIKKEKEKLKLNIKKEKEKLKLKIKKEKEKLKPKKAINK